ncbi:hypothetical protein [Mangrovibacterium lignilyticum]|uniref:hypothetical protein n=1 Tax=Mangrovibacterium lignilyticum TaxID=2668052 RepID=UPI0013CFC613|nr:hypothetical protein [Mangrovibacterium lignilyticum]
MKSDIKYFVISTLITMFTLTVAFVLFDLYAPLEDVFAGIPFGKIDFWSAVHLQPKLPVIVGVGIALNYRKLKAKKQEAGNPYRG